MDRAHRLGQQRAVNVYRLIMRGTLEEKIMSLQRFKMSVANTVINADNSSLNTMDTAQLLDLFTMSTSPGKVTLCFWPEVGLGQPKHVLIFLKHDDFVILIKVDVPTFLNNYVWLLQISEITRLQVVVVLFVMNLHRPAVVYYFLQWPMSESLQNLTLFSGKNVCVSFYSGLSFACRLAWQKIIWKMRVMVKDLLPLEVPTRV